MKTNFKRISKKTLSVVIVAMMVLSTMLVGMVSANAAISYWALLGGQSGGSLSWNKSDMSYTISGSSGSVTYDTNNNRNTIYFKMTAVEESKYYVNIAEGSFTAGTSRQLTWSSALDTSWTNVQYWPKKDTDSDQSSFTPTKRYVTFTISVSGQNNYLTITESDSAQGSDNSDTTTIYFDNSTKNWSTVSAYVFDDNKNGYKDWHGESMTKISGTDIWSYTFPSNYTYVVFNDGTSDDSSYANGKQTNDLSVKNGYVYSFDGTSKEYTPSTSTEATTTTSGGNNDTASKWSIVGRFGIKYPDGTTKIAGTSTSTWNSGTSSDLKLYQDADNSNLYYIDTGYTMREIAANNTTDGSTWYLRFADGKNVYGYTSTSADKALSETDAGTKYTTKVLEGDNKKSFYFTGNDTSGTVILWLDTSTSTPTFYFTISSTDNSEKGKYTISTTTGLGGSVTVTNTTHPSYSGTADEGDSITVTAAAKSGYTYAGMKIEAGDISHTTDASTNSYTFDMPAANAKITATFNVNKDEAYSGNMLWVDTQPSVTTSKIALVKWTNKTGSSSTSGNNYTLYVPSGVDLTTMPVYYSFDSLNINGTSVAQGGTYAFENGKTYTVNSNYNLTITQSSSASIYTVTSGDLQTSTTSEELAKDISGTTLFKNGEFLTVSENGKISNKLMTLSQIKGRGNSSWKASWEVYGKYAYNIKLDSKIDPLGMGATKAKSFCLLANNMDESLLRNVVTYQTALNAGVSNTPHFKVADLYNNGEYLGSYLITEKVDVGSSKLVNGETVEDYHNDSSATGNTVKTSFEYNSTTIEYQYVDTGSIDNGVDYTKKSYLLEFDLEDRAKAENCWFKTPQGQYIALKSPEDLNSIEMQFIIKKWIDAETAVYNSNYTTANKLMDLDSFADVYLVQEFTKNLDSCATSYYVYYDGTQDSPKWQATPIWDYDWALGGYNKTKDLKTGTFEDASNDPSTTTGWFAKYKAIVRKDSVVDTSKFNFQAQLANMDKFWTDNVKKQWNTDFYSSILEVFGTSNTNDGEIYDFFSSNLASFTMNETRYGFISSDLTSSWGSVNTGSNPTEAYSYLKEWGIKRATWMNEQLSALTGVSVTANASTYVQGDTITLTATPNPSYVNCTYSYYFTTSETISDNDTCMKTTSSDSFSFNATDTGEWYFYVKATDGVTTVTSDPIKLSIIEPQGEHTVTIYFKSPSAAAYTPSVKLNSGSYVTLEKDTLLGKTYSGTLTIYWYKVDLTIDSTKENTLTFKTKRATQKATITDKFNGDTYYLAVDNIINGTKVVDLTNEKEYIRNYYHSAANLVYSSTSEYNLGFTNINGTRYAMGTYLDSSVAAASVNDLSMDESVIMPLSASKMVSSVSASSSSSDVTVESATMIQKVVAGLASVSELQTQLFDVDLSGELDIKDATLIQKYLAGY